jgi:hypothetical protein
MFSEFRKRAMKERLAMAGGYRGSSLHKAGESGEDSTDFTGMFEPVIIAFSVAVVTHHIASVGLGSNLDFGTTGSLSCYK